VNAQLRESLYDLYEIGGLELAQQGANGIRRELLIDLETSGLDPGQHEIIRYHAVNVRDEDDEFFEYARPRELLCDLAEEITVITNADLAQCRPSRVVLGEFLSFINGAATISKDSSFEHSFLNRASERISLRP
jgi:DNA polymerase III alpha subunit (gram-positive type)